MKNYIMAGFVVITFIPQLAFASFDANLTYGAHGQAVLELQNFLKDQGVYRGSLTGYFYSLTRSAVKAFQTKLGIVPASGYFGPLTRTKANEILAQADSQASAGQTAENAPSNVPTSPITPSYSVPTPYIAPTTPSQNTAPVSPSVTTAPAVQTPVATKISIVGTGSGSSYLELPTGNCGAINFYVSVYDQQGNKMIGENVTMVSSSLTVTIPTKEYLNNNTDWQRGTASFIYTSRATSTQETVVFTDGNLSTSALVHMGEKLQPSKITQDSTGQWRIIGEGNLVDPVTMMCK